MGICLDTDQQDGSQVFEEAGAQNTERWRREAGILATPPGGNFPMQNVGPVKFESPTVPVIFVLGGPGSGKVTHCDNLTQEKKGIIHINMTDLLQQYTLGNDMQDFGLLSSKTVTEVLMLELKMSPGAKTFLVSGYPRNMRDVVEYSEKIQIVNGVVLVAWKQEVLERQIVYGAQLGQVIIELAKMELRNFYKNVMPVAEYFDQSEMLLVVNGERNPTEVYVDFRDAVLRILGLSEEGEASKRQVTSSIEAEVDVEPEPVADRTDHAGTAEQRTEAGSEPTPTSEPVIGDEILPSKTSRLPRKGLPPIVWILGGPGSNKSMVCTQAIRKMPKWVHLSMGSLLVALSTNNSKVREYLVSGELVPSDVVMKLVEQQIHHNRESDGIIIDGFPRDLQQAKDFQNKFGQKPEMLLLDVSRQQVGRGRLYDGADVFERRLDLFRELALPMLKSLDAAGRLSIVDGDTELPADRQKFASALLELMRRVARNEDDPNRISVLGPEEDGEEGEEEEGVRRPASKNAPNGMAKPVGNGINHMASSDLVTDSSRIGAPIPTQRQHQHLVTVNGGLPVLRRVARQVIANGRLRRHQHEIDQRGRAGQRRPDDAPLHRDKHRGTGPADLLQKGPMANGLVAMTGGVNRVGPLEPPPGRGYRDGHGEPHASLHI